MATQTKRNAQGNTGDGADAGAAMAGLGAAASTVAEIQRQQLAAGMEALSILFRAGEAVQQAQLQMRQRSALLHSQAADNIRRATSPMEVASIQSTLVMYEVQEAMRYGQELMAAVARSGTDLIKPAPGVQENVAAGASPAASMMGAAMTAAAPMADAFQQFFSAPMKAAQAAQAAQQQTTH